MHTSQANHFKNISIELMNKEFAVLQNYVMPNLNKQLIVECKNICKTVYKIQIPIGLKQAKMYFVYLLFNK